LLLRGLNYSNRPDPNYVNVFVQCLQRATFLCGSASAERPFNYNADSIANFLHFVSRALAREIDGLFENFHRTLECLDAGFTLRRALYINALQHLNQLCYGNESFVLIGQVGNNQTADPSLVFHRCRSAKEKKERESHGHVDGRGHENG